MSRRMTRPRLVLVAGVVLGLAVAGLTVPDLISPAAAATKTVYLPASWGTDGGNGDVPWTSSRTKQSDNFILLWGDEAGTDPTTAATAYRFDPGNVLSQLESLYSYYVNTMQFTPETGYLAKYKIDVIITQTWSNRDLNDWATGGSADGVVGVINIAPGAAQPGSWGLARVPELHVPRPPRIRVHGRLVGNVLGDQRRVHGHAGLPGRRRR